VAPCEIRNARTFFSALFARRFVSTLLRPSPFGRATPIGTVIHFRG
jgi:hypothetical protein